MKKIVVVFLTCCCLFGVAYSSDAFAKPKKRKPSKTVSFKTKSFKEKFVENAWKGSFIEAGGFFSKGNSRNVNLHTEYFLKYNSLNWLFKNNTKFDFIKSYKTKINTKTKTKTKEIVVEKKIYTLEWLEKKLTPSNSIYQSFMYVRDNFDGFDYNADFNLGYKHRILKTPQLNLALFGGPGVHLEKLDPKTQKKLAYAEGRYAFYQTEVGFNFSWLVTNNVTFNQDAYVFIPIANRSIKIDSYHKHYAELTTDIVYKINSHLNLSIDNHISYNPRLRKIKRSTDVDMNLILRWVI